MECLCNNWLCNNWLSLLSIVVSFIVPFLLYTLKPKLKIEKLELGVLNDIKVKVINQRCCSHAINVNIEMCLINKAKETYHLEIDKGAFLIIPRKKNKEKEDNWRYFKAVDLCKTTKERYWEKDFASFIREMVKVQGATIRIRVYATHSLTGFGRARSKRFQYNEKENKFVIVKK